MTLSHRIRLQPKLLAV